MTLDTRIKKKKRKGTEDPERFESLSLREQARTTPVRPARACTRKKQFQRPRNPSGYRSAGKGGQRESLSQIIEGAAVPRAAEARKTRKAGTECRAGAPVERKFRGNSGRCKMSQPRKRPKQLRQRVPASAHREWSARNRKKKKKIVSDAHRAIHPCSRWLRARLVRNAVCVPSQWE